MFNSMTTNKQRKHIMSEELTNEQRIAIAVASALSAEQTMSGADNAPAVEQTDATTLQSSSKSGL